MVLATRKVAIPSVLVTLAACGGGGGGGDGAVEVPFSSFSSIVPNQTVVMNASAVTANVTYMTDPFTGDVTVQTAGFTPEGAGTVRLTYDGSRALNGIAINTPQPNSSVSFNQGTPNHAISCGSGTCLAESPTASAVAADPFFFNWNYQTFGVWGVDTGPGNTVFGALSAGSVTPGAALPMTGTSVLFTGITAGFYVNPSGVPHGTAATVNATVNFTNQTILFNTFGTTVVNANTPGATPTLNTDLNLTGNLSYAPGVNAFSGTVSAAPSTGLTGQASGRFYGPAAEEMGGTYTLGHPTNVSRLMGGFGAKR